MSLRSLADEIDDAPTMTGVGRLTPVAGGRKTKPISATPFGWPDPRSIPTRPWLMGHWLLAGEVTAIIAPGGTGKSTIGNAIALSLASGQPLLGKPLHRGTQAAWIYNLEDAQDELDRQISAAALFYGITPDDCGGRLLVDSGLDQPLCTAKEDQQGFALAEDVFDQLTATIRARKIAVVTVDPFVSSHMVSENNNGAIDGIAKRWKRLAKETGCAVVLVHHTKKLGGREVTAEDGRGAVALRDAARVVLPLNPMGDREAEELGITDPVLRRSLVRIDTGKANRAPADAATWIKLESQSLDNGQNGEPSDFVGVATLWEKPDAFEGISPWHLYEVQQAIKDGEYRDSVQAKDWAGHAVASVLSMSAERDKGRIKSLLRSWIGNGALAIERRTDGKGNIRPFVVVGNELNPAELGPRPHLERCGVEGVESGGAALR